MLKKRIRIHRLKNYKYHEKYPYTNIITGIQQRCKKFGIACDLTVAWTREMYTGKCSLTGIPFVRIKGKVNCYHPSVDRIRPELGYIKDNCRWVLLSINCLKFTGTDSDMYEIAAALCNNVQPL